ncbi:hypothetical protein [Photobacterium satsumensis]|uniref:hypothetical protein n=1 Tax=Photobacterium satsumensis TaxID=2910239 RepID=UPI003D0B4469
MMSGSMVLVIITTAAMADSGLAEEYITRKSSNEFQLAWNTTAMDKFNDTGPICIYSYDCNDLSV